MVNSIEFINEFPADRLDGMEPYGEPFVPEYVYNALREQKKFDTLRGRQEDSEEFLCFLLDGLHEEMTAVLKEQHDKKEAEAKANGGGDWLEVGAKNKTSNLRSVSAYSLYRSLLLIFSFSRLDLTNHLFLKYLEAKRDQFYDAQELKILSTWSPFNLFPWIFSPTMSTLLKMLLAI